MSRAGLEAIVRGLADTAGRTADTGRTMPAAFYTDPDWLELETEHLFRREWLCVGRVEEIDRPGRYMTHTLLGEPLVITHGRDGHIRALSNVCRHRGALVASGKGEARRLLCPYHHWAYELDGRLAAAPDMPERPDFSIATCRLPAFPCETWQGFVFVNLDRDAPPLSPRLADLEARLRPYHMEEMRLAGLGEEVWETNWKSLVENYMEGYHISPLHQATLYNLNLTDLCRRIEPGETWFGYEVYFPRDLPRVTRGHPDLTPEQADACLMAMIVPSSGIGLAADYSSFLCIQPEGPDRVRLKFGLLFWGDWSQEQIDRAIALNEATMAEDSMVLESIRRGQRSAWHETGPLAPGHLEGTIHDLARHIGRRMAPALATL